MVAMDRPRSLKRLTNSVKTLTIAIRPNSAGVSKCAKTAVEAICRINLAACAPTVTTPPRTDRPFISALRCDVSKKPTAGLSAVMNEELVSSVLGGDCDVIDIVMILKPTGGRFEYAQF